MKNYYLFLLGIMVFFSGSLSGQRTASIVYPSDDSHGINATERNCATLEKVEESFRENPGQRDRFDKIQAEIANHLENGNLQRGGAITIPVVVHVIYRTPSQDLSIGQIQSQIDVLNQDFRRLNPDASNTPPVFQNVAADAMIDFCLASTDPQGNPSSGILKYSTNVQDIGGTSQYYSLATAWNTQEYLNIWVCEIGGGVLGFAYFPGTAGVDFDGVVIDHKYFGTTGTAVAPFDLGRTATHEVGHWLNLQHIWGDGDCSQDDGIADTPLSDAPNFGCPTGHVSCNTTDMVENFMDYSDDACMNIFTQGQAISMGAAISASRSGLITSNGCGNGTPPTPTNCGTQEVTLNYPLNGTQVLMTGSNWGYVAGTNSFGDLAKANFVSNDGSITQVDGLRLGFGAAAAGSPNSYLIATIWESQNGQPGGILGTELFYVSDLINSNLDLSVEFSSGIQVTGDFFAGVQFNYAIGDTSGLLSNSNGDSPPGIAWERWSNGSWYSFSDSNSWQQNIRLAVYPMVRVTGTFDVLVSATTTVINSGQNVVLTASGADQYFWYPATGLSDPNIATPIATPTQTTTYYVVGSDSAGNCVDTASVTITVNPVSNCSPAQNLSVSNISSNSAFLSWSASGSVSQWQVAWRPSGGVWTTMNIPGTFITVSGLMPGTNYEWKVKDRCNSPSSVFGWSQVENFTTLTNVCVQPSNLTATNIGMNSVNLGWDVSPAGQEVQIAFREQSPGSIWSTRMISGTQSYFLSGINENTTYEWKIRDRCLAPAAPASQFGWTALSTFTTDAPPVCGQPTNLSASNLGPNSARLNWDAVPPGPEYQIAFREMGVGATWGTRLTSDLFFDLTGLSENATYEWKVRDRCGNPTTFHGWTSTSQFTTVAATCAKPANLTSNVLSTTSAIISWTTSIQVSNLQVAWRPLGGTYSIENVSFNALSLDNLSPGTTYEWKVRDRCNFPSSPGTVYGFSPLMSFTTPLFREQQQSEIETMVFPNPFSSEINVRFSENMEGPIQVDLVDLTGKVLQSDIKNSAILFQWNIENIPSGIYFLKVSGSDYHEVFKIRKR